ncbi:hypothetical protein E2C01_037059 [Portunus trituberculatus]|uniref:HTH psq-type domain-containing protein n=1 Tax=Portunus trituberculatus TaxID=210409 RepID=A0A5B7FAE1_PORTR|nr:hypothetical protein [Portunus trituberculatus]
MKGKKTNSIACHYGLTPSSVSTIFKSADSIKKAGETISSLQAKRTTQTRDSAMDKMEPCGNCGAVGSSRSVASESSEADPLTTEIATTVHPQSPGLGALQTREGGQPNPPTGVEQKPLVRIASARSSLGNIEGGEGGHTGSCNRYWKPLLFHPLGYGFAVDFVGICATPPLKGTPLRV